MTRCEGALLSAYEKRSPELPELFAARLAWLQSQTIDYVTPQLYWPFGGGQDYGLLLPWWALQTNGRHLYPGQAAYRITRWNATEMPRQIRLNRQTTNAHGSVFFRANSGITNNPFGFADSLENNFYRYPALMPSMPWKDNIVPEVPVNFIATDVSEGTRLNWEASPVAADGDTARFYVIYRHESGQVFNHEDPEFILDIVHGNVFEYLDTNGPGQQTFIYYVSALDRLHNESELSDPVALIFTSVESEPEIVPETYVLEQNYPNPFNPLTTISFRIGNRDRVMLAVYNILAQRVALLVDEELIAGKYDITFNAGSLPSGVYFYRLQTSQFADTKKMTLNK